MICPILSIGKKYVEAACKKQECAMWVNLSKIVLRDSVLQRQTYAGCGLVVDKPWKWED